MEDKQAGDTDTPVPPAVAELRAIQWELSEVARRLEAPCQHMN